MPSPFPGIDPFVEAQGRWTDFHPRLIFMICDELNDHLPGDYLAQIGERLDVMGWSADRPRAAYPDVMISRRPTIGPRPENDAATAVADWGPSAIPLLEVEEEVEVRYTWVEVLRLPEQKLVTSIEVLSPANKSGAGRLDYLMKFDRLWRADVNLVEIDLLLGGQRLNLARPHPPGDYCVTIARAGNRPICEVSAWSVRQAPPTVPIPLQAPDPDVPLGMARLVQRAYERGRYERALDYSKALELPLHEEDRQWVEETARGSTRPS